MDPYHFTDSDESSMDSIASSQCSDKANGATHSNQSENVSADVLRASNSKSKYSSDACVELAFEFLRGEKINSLLLSTKCDNHLFTRNGVCALGDRYRCKDRSCRGSVVYCKQKNICMRLQSTPPHKHKRGDHDTDYWNLVALNEMRDRFGNLATLAGGKRLASVRSIFVAAKQELVFIFFLNNFFFLLYFFLSHFFMLLMIVIRDALLDFKKCRRVCSELRTVFCRQIHQMCAKLRQLLIMKQY